MLALRNLLLAGGVGMTIVAVYILAYDLYRGISYRRAVATAEAVAVAVVVRWRLSLALAMLAWGPLLMAFSIVVVPSGHGGRAGEPDAWDGAGTLYPGVHLVMPLMEDVALFDTRDQIFTTGMPEDENTAAKKTSSKLQPLNVQAKEGLTLGLAITVRYRLDAKRLDYIEGNLPRPVEKEIVTANGGERVARDCSELHGARCFFGEARGSAAKAAGLIRKSWRRMELW